MRVKFANGVVKECTAPIEQKVFKRVDGKTEGAGWLLILRLKGGITSAELDTLLTAENVKTMRFSTINEDDEETALFILEDYETITSSSIRHAENATLTQTEIQMSKGI